ncbi:MAG: FGGY-family carbohydrate kinase [Prolixibacteraceae bacterium]|jgi:rhamnulokinase|nr:FGGY-family carbohydrate kinase [Prolixibacteraceae bacterium]
MNDPISYLAIDMGAGSIRLLQGIFTDRLEIKEIGRFTNSIDFVDGHDRWNLEYITNELKALIDKAFCETEVPIRSIGADSWGVDFVLLGNDGKPLEDPVAYRDKRTDGMYEKWCDNVMSGFDTFKRTGINYNIFNSLYQFLSIKDTSLLREAHTILFISDYVNYFLSGVMANELTLSSTTQMLNVETGKWDTEITGYIGINDMLPELPVMPGTVLGHLKLDNRIDTRVIATAGHDTASAVAAIPYEEENFAFISTGTWCIAGMLSEKPLLSQKAYEACITNERAANNMFRPLKNIMGLWLVQQLRVAFGGVHSYSEIDEMARNVDRSFVLIDPDDPVFFNPDNMKEAFDEYLKKKGIASFSSAAAYYRCAYESLANSFNKTIKELELLRGYSFKNIHLTGGGSKSDLLCKLTAQYAGKKVIAGPVEGAAIGNIIIQAEADGVVKSDDDARKMIARSFDVNIFTPKTRI